ncbi:MAG: RNA polymerase sigma factor [Planctomycetes bacterium]|nr:RNA polymerase sigma factor [Planctomycetota bacterium]
MEERSELDTQALVRAAKSGDVQRFSELYERIAPTLHAWATLRIRPAQRAQVDPEDVVAEVWVRAWKAFPEFDEQSSFRAWVFRIGKNVLLESFRRARHSNDALDAGPTTRMARMQQLPDPATQVSRRVARHEGVAKLLEWVGELEPEQRQLVLHCGFEGLSYAEAAERMAENRDTIAKRWQVLRERLVRFGTSQGLAFVD